MLEKLVKEKDFDTFNNTLIQLATKLGILNNQNNFGDLLQEVASWKLDMSLDYKKNLNLLGKKYNVLGLIFQH